MNGRVGLVPREKKLARLEVIAGRVADAAQQREAVHGGVRKDECLPSGSALFQHANSGKDAVISFPAALQVSVCRAAEAVGDVIDPLLEALPDPDVIAAGKLAKGADNFVTLTGSLQGKATAQSRPQLELGVATSVQSHLRVPSVVVVDYRSVVNGKPKLAVSVSASRNDAGALVLNLSEATAGLAMSVTENDATADLKLNNGSVIGRLERNGRMTYVDGSFESLY